MKRLNFGCGSDIKIGWDNCDIQPNAQIVFDFNKFPYPLKQDYYDYVLLKNVLEHLSFPKLTLYELSLCCKKNAVIDIIIPHYTNRSAYDDLDHVRYLSEISFRYFIEQMDKIEKTNLFKIQSLKVYPSRIGKIIPQYFRNKLSLLLNGLQSYIRIRLIVKKD